MTKNSVFFEDVHGNAAFPANLVFNNTSMTGRYQENFVYCHWHHHLEFIHIAEGRALFELDKRQVEAGCGQALLINSGELHSGYALDHAPCSLYAFIFDPGMLSFSNNDCCEQNFIKPFLVGKFKLPSLITGCMPWENEILYSIRKIIELFEHPHTGYELKVKAALYCIFADLVENNGYVVNDENTLSQSMSQIERIKQVISFIEKNYNRKIYIHELASLANLSTEYFFKLFKSITLKTPVEYINYCRIKEAEILLRERDLSILDVALSTGYDNVSYFIKVFKHLNHCTPHEYRKNVTAICSRG